MDDKKRKELLGKAAPSTPPVATEKDSTKSKETKENKENKSKKLTDEEEKFYLKEREAFQSTGPSDINADFLDIERLDITTEDLQLETLDDDMEHIISNQKLQEILKGTTNLKEYSKDVETKLFEVERGTIGDYLKEGEAIASLYRQIGACDVVLEQLESLLTNFQTDIKNVGTEIKMLQEQCLAQQMKITNRKNVQDQIHSFTAESGISEAMEETLARGEINEKYLKMLLDFNRKMAFVENQKVGPSMKRTPSEDIVRPSLDQQRAAINRTIRDIEPKVESLKHKAINRIRQHLMNQFHSFKSAEDLKKHHKELLQYGYLYQFLFKHAPDVAEDLKANYKSVTARLYLNYFKSYVQATSKLRYEIANKNDLVGVDDSKSLGFFSGKRTIKYKASVFALGIRQKIVDELDKPTALLLNSSNEKYPYEVLFKAILFLLMEKVTDEMGFTQDFFLFDMDWDLFNDIFGKVIEIFQENLAGYTTTSFDPVGICIIVVTLQKYKVLMSKRLVSVLDPFFESAMNDLVDRFFYVFELNTTSIRNVQPKDILQSIELQPHYITRRYAELVVSVLYLSAISSEMGDKTFVERMNLNLDRMREEMAKCLMKMCEAKFKDWRSQTIFYINNYDLIVSVIKEREMKGADVAKWEKNLTIKINDFTVAEMKKPFGKLLEFAAVHGPSVADDNNNEDGKTTAKEEEVDALLKNVDANWKKELEAINNNLLKEFSNFKCGSRLFQKIVDDVVAAYNVLVKVTKKYFPNLRKNLPQKDITYDMKKMCVSFDNEN